ncbi:hypothetical protein AVEN_114698-1 [Araneus ventricosus]|uniref:Uncharacterized protein n=1 Tax=Araneus ventricosus TaxID=182803 RepID=A0A4Y2RP94_ARAVE|nr:hypothetical protein AVEN_114698-1 [Araneus ventricosus]
MNGRPVRCKSVDAFRSAGNALTHRATVLRDNAQVTGLEKSVTTFRCIFALGNLDFNPPPLIAACKHAFELSTLHFNAAQQLPFQLDRLFYAINTSTTAPPRGSHILFPHPNICDFLGNVATTLFTTLVNI